MRLKIHSVYHLRRFLRYRTDGATLIEYALLAPVFFLLLMGMMDFGLMMTKWVLTDNALNQVSRSAIVNPALDIQSEINKKTAGLVRFDNQDTCLRVRYFSSYAALNAAPIFSNCSSSGGSAGAAGNYVLYEVILVHRFITPIGGLLRLVGGDSSFESVRFRIKTILRNE
jgi:Flp pilus assembly pilin Flp